MEYKQWINAIRPKVLGTRNLHAQFGYTLDFFVMLSSIMGALGGTSQANYSAGGAFQDAFARMSSLRGHPTVSIDIGMVPSIGFVAETKGVAERLTKIGFRPVEEEEVLRLVECAIRTPLRHPGTQRHSQIITGLLQFENVDNVSWREDLRFTGLRRLRASKSRGSTDGLMTESNVSFELLLSNSASLAEATDHITDAMANKLAEMFMVSVTEIDKSQALSKCGVDSLVAVELRNWLVSKLQTEISIFDILQSVSLIAVAAKAATKSKFVLKAGLVMSDRAS
jgi:aryl carrier-like protein